MKRLTVISQREAKPMEDINSIIERLDKGWDVKEARRAVADLIVEDMQSAKDSFSYWEKFHFANAISAFGTCQPHMDSHLIDNIDFT